jgi:lipopolysaccharide assembly outer membrane protein LptD (OstA)
MRVLPRIACILILGLALREAEGREPTGKPVAFDGYTVADSLVYSADDIMYEFDPPRIILTGNARIEYQDRTLQSRTITYWQDHAYVEATGAVDSTGAPVDTPVFIDAAGEELHGRVIKYNLLTQNGSVIRGRTQYESGYMSAGVIKRTSDDTLYVSGGSYTTCDDEDHPHYFFSGTKMKLIVNDKLIIKPVVAYLHNIPVAWFPFYVFPIKKGRQSGFLTPRYGSSRRDGRYMSNVGYYFAVNDYLDYKAAGTLRERSGWVMDNWFNYNRQNTLSGSMYGSFERRTGDVDSRQWKFRGSHRHTVSPTLSVSGQAQFESSTYSQFNSRNMYERMNRDMRSTLSIRKQWKGSGSSLITTLSYNKNLDNDNITSTLPDVSYRTGRKPLFGGGKKSRTKRKYVKVDDTPEEESRWYESIYYSFNARMNNRDDERDGDSDYTRNLDLSSSLSGSQKFMGWLVAEPSLNLREGFEASSKNDPDEHYERSDNISGRMGLGTTFYGMFAPRIGSISAVRHVVNPTISYSYGLRRSFAGEDFDSFYRFDENDLNNGRTNSVTFNLRNIFQAKMLEGEEEKKLDLFTLNFATSMNMEAEKRKIAPLSTTFDIKPREGVTTRLTARHQFYHEDDSFQLLSPYLENLNLTTTVRLSPEQLGLLSRSSRGDANSSLGSDSFDSGMGGMGGMGGMAGAGMSGMGGMGGMGSSMGSGGRSSGKGFSLNFSHTYGIRRQPLPGKDKYRVTHSIKPNLSVSPTASTSIQYYCNYDVESESIVYQRIILNRSLHCWEANLSWVPSGLQEGFYFKVNIVDLPDVKIEQRRGSSRMSY